MNHHASTTRRAGTRLVRTALLSLAALAPIGVSRAAPSGGEDADAARIFSQGRADAAAALVADLAGLAEACAGDRLYAERDRQYEALLRFDPDHADARKTLGYRRGRDGVWARKSQRAARDRGDAPEDLAERLAAPRRTYRDRIVALLAEHGTSIATELREEAWEDLLALDPCDPDARAARGEVPHPAGGRWVLAETAAALERRPLLLAAARAALLDAPAPREVEPRGSELALGVDWTGAVATDEVRVLGTYRPAELAELARHAQAALDLFREAAVVRHHAPGEIVVVALAAPGERAAFEAAHSVMSARRPDYARFTNYWIPEGPPTLVIGEDTFERAVDQVEGQLVALVVADAFRLTRDASPLVEGLCAWVDELLVDERVRALPPPATHAEPAAAQPYQAFKSQHAPRWTQAKELGQRELDLAGTTASTTRPDPLLGYALASYLLEARPDDGRRMLGRLGVGRTLEQASREGLGLELHQLEARLGRWLDEVP